MAETMNRRTALKLGVAGVTGALLAGSGILQGCAAFGKKRKAIAINGSARKDMNTAKLLEKAMEGAQSEGAEVELFHLYDYTFKGCVSCLRCKRKDEDLGGLCAYKDSITPLLEKCLQADAVILGSPIYYDNISGMMRSFLERLLYPVDANKFTEDRQMVRILNRKIPFGMIYTMNAPEMYAKEGYAHVFKSIENRLTTFFGSCEAVFSCDTYQFKDYSRYDANMFSEEHKAAQREKQWPIDCEYAYKLGEGLARKARTREMFE